MHVQFRAFAIFFQLNGLENWYGCSCTSRTVSYGPDMVYNSNTTRIGIAQEYLIFLYISKMSRFVGKYTNDSC